MLFSNEFRFVITLQVGPKWESFTQPNISTEQIKDIDQELKVRILEPIPAGLGRFIYMSHYQMPVSQVFYFSPWNMSIIPHYKNVVTYRKSCN